MSDRYGPNGCSVSNTFVADLIAQRDALLAACKAAKRYFEPQSDSSDEDKKMFRRIVQNDPIWQQLTAAIQFDGQGEYRKGSE